MRKRLTIEQMREIARARNGQCLSTSYVNNRTYLTWKCKKDHIWQAAPSRIKSGTWCPKCAIELIASKKKFTIEKMQLIAQQRNGKCLSLRYSGIYTKLKWQCAKGHTWYAEPNRVKNSNAWCTVCSGRKRLTIKDMQETARKKKGKCLSNRYGDYRTKLIWQCQYLHKWKARANDIRRGNWCAICSTGRNEFVCRRLFEYIFSHPFPKQRPHWLKNAEGNILELDGYNTELQLAFEYQGEQHYTEIGFFSSRSLEKIKFHDRLKRKLCSRLNVKLIEIPYIIQLDNFFDYIVGQCQIKNIPLLKGLKKVDYRTLDIYGHDKLGEMKRIAAKRGGKCLSTYYINTDTNLEWQCEYKHVWKAAPSDIKQGNWCAKCYGNVKATIEEIQFIAKKKGGVCLSKEYKSTDSKLTWKCIKGHIWQATPYHIKYDTWCPTCARNKRLTIEEMKEIAQQRNGKCLSSSYKNSSTYLLWQCQKGHVWQAWPSNIKLGRWCPECVGKKPKPLSLFAQV